MGRNALGQFSLSQERHVPTRSGLAPRVAPVGLRQELNLVCTAHTRTAVADFEIRGQAIRTGDSVLAAIGSANHDPAVFADPDRLDVGRYPNEHLAFG